MFSFLNKLILFLLVAIHVWSKPMTCLNITLQEAEQIAIENNKLVNATAQIYEKGVQGRLEAFSKWLPKIEAYTAAYETSQTNNIYGYNSQFVTQLSLTQTLFDSNTYYGTKIATLEMEKLKQLLDAAVNDVLYATRKAYYQVIYDYENLATAQEHVNLLTSLAERMMDNYRIGTAILYNVNQSKVAVANATSRYYMAQKELKVNIDKLVKVLGFNPGSKQIAFPQINIPIMDIPEIAQKISLVENIFKKQSVNDFIYKEGFPKTQQILMSDLFTEEEIQDWEMQALNYRPSLKEVKKKFDVASERVKSEKGEYYPTLTLNMGYGGLPTPFSFFLSPNIFDQQMVASVGVSLQWLVFDGLGRERRIKKARAEQNALLFEYQDSLQTTFAQVRRQIFDIEESVANFITSDGNVSLADQTLVQSYDQLNVGYITIFDYQIAIDNLIEAKNIRNKAKYDLITAYYGLLYATGVDLKNR